MSALAFDRVLQGDGNVEFSYRLMAKRLGYESAMLERAPWADDDPNLYPEKLDAWEAAERELHAVEPEEVEDEEWLEEAEPAAAEPEPLVQPVEPEVDVPEAEPEVIYGFHLHLPLVVE